MTAPQGWRGSWWTRWPDERTGPLWAGIHLREAAGLAVVVGVEIFSEPPADARHSPGPASETPAPPWSARAVTRHDLRPLSINALVRGFLVTLDPEEQAALSAAGIDRPGRKRTYDGAHWGAVARVALEARAAGGSQAASIANRFGVSTSTAKHWINQCRQRELIP